MIERLDPFNLPQRGADRLVLSPPAPKVEKSDDPSDGPRASQVPRQRKSKVPRRK
jgi:hypothetical protein